MKVDILNLEWPHSNRDQHISLPVCIYLKKKYGLCVQRENIFNGFWCILKYRPKLVFISNSHGSFVNLEIMKFANALGIKTVSLISEGNPSEAVIDSFLWGVNTDKIFYQDALIMWSERTKKMAEKHAPSLIGKIYVSGGTGFDRYQYLKKQSNEIFKDKHGISSFKKVIGIACWAFDLFSPGPYYDQLEKTYLSEFGEDQISLFRSDREKVREIYLDLVRSNRDILFILRYHPGNINYENCEFKLCLNEPNVFISDPKANKEIQIEDLINISDIWVSYESTTNLEAWLMNKPTFFVNPTRSDFTRSELHRGNPIAKSKQEAQIMIDEYYSSGKIAQFESLNESRNKVISEIIGWADGKNSERAADIIYSILTNGIQKTIAYKDISLYRVLKSTLKYFLRKDLRASNTEKHDSTYSELN